MTRTGRLLTTEGRDPRLDPQKGDVLIDGQMRIEVTLVGRFVHYDLIQPGGFGIYDIPMRCKQTRKQWQEWAKRSEVRIE